MIGNVFQIFLCIIYVLNDSFDAAHSLDKLSSDERMGRRLLNDINSASVFPFFAGFSP